MDKLKWYFVWSDKYGIFCDILTSLISDKYFDLYPIEKPQSLFDKNTYHADKHFLAGMFIKDYEIMNILNSLPEDEYFIFSDVDMIAYEDELYTFIKRYLECTNDIVFYKESEDRINVCFMLIKNTKKVKELYTAILEDHIINPNEADGDVMNRLLKRWNGKYSMFPPEYICSNVNIDRTQNDYSKMCVYQGMCTAFNNYRLNNLEKLIAFNYNCNIDLSESITTLINELESDHDKKKILDLLSIYNNAISSDES